MKEPPHYGEVNQLYSLFLSCGMAVFTFTLTLFNKKRHSLKRINDYLYMLD